ncbi:MAG: QueT transporter family protein, partial [Solobacterium sp.]|nr:QueT transporter family protein [Solobacterium sp.]
MNAKKMARIGLIAAVYTVLTLGLAPFSFGPIQVRISEALTLLPLIWKPSIAALTLGCFLSNLLGVALNMTGPIDIVVGTMATFLAAVCTWRLRNNKINGIPVWGILMPVIFNGVFVGLEL